MNWIRLIQTLAIDPTKLLHSLQESKDLQEVLREVLRYPDCSNDFLWQLIYGCKRTGRKFQRKIALKELRNNPFQNDTFHSYERYIRDVASILGSSFTGKFTDIGSGDGFPCLVLALLYPKATFVGYEINAQKIKNAKEAAERLGLSNVQFIHQDLGQQRFRLPESDYYYMYAPCGGKVTEKILKDILRYPKAKLLNSYTLGCVSGFKVPKNLKVVDASDSICIYQKGACPARHVGNPVRP